ncbi:MAG TPA: hypothetical protein VMM18_15515 [Gemmatimonadaceae bacterium]|nr:hypothetical protein [Gemmatimonadaceae bacterium]
MPEQNQPPDAERRARQALRKLIEEMMAQLRDAVRQDGWTAEERAQAERDLQRIMESVRKEAMREHDSGGK